ncbi:uncharacterized protein LOC128347628 [Hemicordylus capensis]|uniref:uncharacterized protein LOC128347628 n=1 Tax=Hemicordylus capensis TaxID=884348 RepID=UPI0023026B8E|nr:uncharacterized protein LOC128347628 [Hemicordylus capensis]
MGPKKAPVKKGGKPMRPTKRPHIPVESSSDDEGDLELGAIRELIARLQALEKQRSAPAGDETGRGPSGVPSRYQRTSRAAKKAKLMQGFAECLEVLEAAAGPSTPESRGSKPLQVENVQGDSSEDPGSDENGAGLQSAGPQAAKGRARVLILGYSFIFWALKWAQGAEPGTQMGLGRWATVDWHGRRGMWRAKLLPMLHEFLKENPAPDILLLPFEGLLCLTVLGMTGGNSKGAISPSMEM